MGSTVWNVAVCGTMIISPNTGIPPKKRRCLSWIIAAPDAGRHAARMTPLLRNCVWLVIPALLWNGIFTSRLGTADFGSEFAVPRTVLWFETIGRIVAFAGPVFLTMRLYGVAGRCGLALLLVGYALYFASWLPHLYWPSGAIALSYVGFLAPYATPLVLFVGIALIGRSWLYGIGTAIFVGAHVAHGLVVFGFIAGSKMG